MGHMWSGCNQFDIVTVRIPEGQHDRGKVLNVCVVSRNDMAYLIILAEGTFQIARREEYRSRASGPRYGRLLAIMGEGMAHHDVICETAESQLACPSVCLAFSGAEYTAFQDFF
jgi:hypothetical protein